MKEEGLMDIIQFLTEQPVSYQRYDHAAVFTVHQANQLDVKIPGLATKNLFLRDGKGKRHWLWVGADDDPLDLVTLAQRLEVKRLSLASNERLAAFLKSAPGRVSLLDMFNAQPYQVTLLVTSSVWNCKSVQCHPFDNAVTLDINMAQLKPLLQTLNNEVVILNK
jgi:Ala-tRNA(Pro) deacylase